MFKELCFIVETEDKGTIYFGCASEDDMNSWLNEIDWRVVAISRAAATIHVSDTSEGKSKTQSKQCFNRWQKRNTFLNHLTPNVQLTNNM
jgi:hypothetical protein